MEIIHIVLGKANPSRMNGVNRVVHELATRQTAAGEDVSLWGITHFPKHDYPDRTYRTMLFKAKRNPFALDRSLLRALREKADGGAVFHFHGGFIPPFYSIALRLRRAGIPYVYTPHGSFNTLAMRRSAFRKKWYFRFFEKEIVAGALAVHCLGKSETEGLSEICAGSRTVVIPYGFESPASPALPVYRGKFLLGFCGRLDIHTKGLDLLLESFAFLLDREPQAELWLIGDGEQRAELEGMALKWGIKDKTIFFGSKFGQEKLALLSQLHVFVHPSRNEGLPTAVLEAASLGIPCVITEATNLGESVRRYQCGEVIDQPDCNLLCHALVKVHARVVAGELALLSANARRMIRQGYNWDNLVQNFHHMYQGA